MNTRLLQKLWLFAGLTLSSIMLKAEPIAFSQCHPENSAEYIYGAECGYISAPLDYTKPSGDSIDIHLMRIPAISPSLKPPIFFIAGGPGQASTALAKRFRYQFSELLTEHDFIFVDQRGTGQSQALDCDINPIDYTHLSGKQFEKLSLERHQDCLREYSHDPSFFFTTSAVKDLEKIRTALMYPKIFLWAGSYGTRVIIDYIRQFEEPIAGAVLDGVAPIAIQLPTYVEFDSNEALHKILSHCQQAPACHRAFPNLSQDWLTLLDTLNNTSNRVQIKHPRTEKQQEVFIDNVIVSAWVRSILYNRDLTTLLPLAMSKATKGDFSQLFSMQAIALANIQDNVSEGMHFATLCAEDREFSQRFPVSVEAHHKLLHIPTDAFDHICKAFPQSRVETSFFEPVKSHIPTLLLSGNFDPATPPRWAEMVKQGFSNAQHITAPGGHHIISTLGCIPALIKNFYSAPENITTLDTECADNIQPLAFFIDSAGPDMHLTKKPNNE